MQPSENAHSQEPVSAWVFDPHSLSLVLEAQGAPRHTIDLRKITSSACMLSIVFDASSRGWASKEIIGDLIKVLQQLFDPQVTLCGSSRERKFDPVNYLQHRPVQ